MVLSTLFRSIVLMLSIVLYMQKVRYVSNRHVAHDVDMDRTGHIIEKQND
jgi:hypothetical protein